MIVLDGGHQTVSDNTSQWAIKVFKLCNNKLWAVIVSH